MNIGLTLEYKEFDSKAEGANFIADEYKIKVERTDQRGLTEVEVRTVLEAYLKKD
jgi:hypothetical protein